MAFTLADTSAARPVSDLKVTVLSTMLADTRGVGEWGYAALVEAGGRKILFDTGARSDVVLNNARDLGIDLSTVEEVVISHNHGDHTGGLITLRSELAKRNPKALSVVHVAKGIFLPRKRRGSADELNGLLRVRSAYEALGGSFVVHERPIELADGVWFSGPVPRIHDERNYPPGRQLIDGGRALPDTLPEDAALYIQTPTGIVLLTGCGHAGVVNLAEHARKTVGPAPLEAVIGGLHLYDAAEATVHWTAKKLHKFGLRHLLAGHCTGVETTRALREAIGLPVRTAAYGSVGSTYAYGVGIDPGSIVGKIGSVREVGAERMTRPGALGSRDAQGRAAPRGSGEQD